MKKSALFLMLMFISLCHFTAFSQQQEKIKEEVVVIGSRIPTDFATLSRTVTIIDRETIQASPARSIPELLQSILSVDLRPRGPEGVQADISIRGSDFSQVLVMVDGIKVTDPQTGHHTLNIPISLEDIERIEVLRGQGSAPYGENALAGAVNIVTKKKGSNNIRGTLSGGLHNSLTGRFSTQMSLSRLHQAFSLGFNRSDGFAFDRDYNILNLTSRTFIDLASANIYLLAGFQDKAFGANGFYGPYPSKEWTHTWFTALKGEIQGTKINLYSRWHRDRFMLDVDHPDQYLNLHRTLSSGIELAHNISLSPAKALAFGGEVSRTSISGDRMGGHSYYKTGLFSEFQALVGPEFQFQAGLRWDYFSHFGGEISPSLSIAYIRSSRLKFRVSAGHAFRIPSFTELFYSSPANRGNPGLKPEHSFSLEGGVDLSIDKTRIAATVFHRRDRDVIDWIKQEESTVWLAENIRQINFSGLEISLTGWDRFSLGYTFLHSDLKRSAYFISKYRLNHPIHQVTGSLMLALPMDARADVSAIFKKRTQMKGYLILDARLRKSFVNFGIFFTVSNLLNIEYEEIPGVRMQGRWIGLGIDFEPIKPALAKATNGV